MAKASNLKLTI